MVPGGPGLPRGLGEAGVLADLVEQLRGQGAMLVYFKYYTCKRIRPKDNLHCIGRNMYLHKLIILSEILMPTAQKSHIQGFI